MKSIKPRVTKKSSKRVANEVAPAGPDWLIALVVVLATGLAFLPILSNEFVEWDDSVNLITNPHYRGLLAGGFAIAALSAQRSSGTLKTLDQYDTFSRIGQAAYGYLFYLWKTLIPIPLSPLYELPISTPTWNFIFFASALRRF
jgi:hypothetical protein